VDDTVGNREARIIYPSDMQSKYREVRCMVDLIVAKCPRCGGDLQVQPGGETAFCTYCDAEILIVDRGGPPKGNDPTVTEIEKKKLAVQLERENLSELELEAARMNGEILAMEQGEGRQTRNIAGGILILLFVLTLFDLIIFPLFYILDISYVWGISHEMCLLMGIVVLVIGIGGIVTTSVSTKMSIAKKREDRMRSPEYTGKVARRQELQEKIQQSKQEVEALEQQLKSLL
jgi:DNA-directed RNA polymerase subunit RPC12/RpoP